MRILYKLVLATLFFNLFSCEHAEEALQAIEGETTLSEERIPRGCERLPEFWINVQDYGAIPGDGFDDTPAFLLASQVVEAECSDVQRTVLYIPEGTYNVGVQVGPGATYVVDGGPFGVPDFTWTNNSLSCYKGLNIIDIDCCPNVTVMGEDNSRLVFSEDLSFGFPNASPACEHCRESVGIMVYLKNTHCSTVENLELFGNLEAIESNGGILNACPVQIIQDNYDGIVIAWSENVLVENVWAHEFGRDGIMIADHDNTEDPNCPYGIESRNIEIRNLNSEYNGRQAFSWTSGHDIKVYRSKFNHTGAIWRNSLGCGLDIEPTFGTCANGYFEECEFIGNWFSGVHCKDPINSWDVVFDRCDFWANLVTGNALTSAVWVEDVRQFRFSNSNIYGEVLSPKGSALTDPLKFESCLFSDLAPDGTPAKVGRGMIDAGSSDYDFLVENSRFDVHYNRVTYLDNTPYSWDDDRRVFENNEFNFYYDDLGYSPHSKRPSKIAACPTECIPSTDPTTCDDVGFFRDAQLYSNVFNDANGMCPIPIGAPCTYGVQALLYDPVIGIKTDGQNTFNESATSYSHFRRSAPSCGSDGGDF